MASDRIKQIGQAIASDDYKHATAEPIFLVQQKIRDYGYESGYEDGYDWIEDGEIVTGLRAKRLTIRENMGRDINSRYKMAYYKDRWEFVTACFTRAGAEAFIARQKHNLKETRIWVDSLFRNQEMIDLRNYLAELGKGATDAG